MCLFADQNLNFTFAFHRVQGEHEVASAVVREVPVECLSLSLSICCQACSAIALSDECNLIVISN